MYSTIGIIGIYETLQKFGYVKKDKLELITEGGKRYSVTISTNLRKIPKPKAKVIKPIEPIEGTGQIKVQGEVWSAKSYNDTYIEQDTEVVIEKIDGVKAIVKPLKETIKN